MVDGVEVQGGIWDAIGFWEQLCAEGSHATAVGGSDDHEGGQGSGPLYSPIGMPTTMVFAESLSVDAILEGVRAGRTVIKVNSIDDPMLETELSGERVGNTVFADTATLSVRVTEGTGNTLQVIKNGVVLETQSIDSDPFTHELSVTAPSEGEDRYRHQVVAVRRPTHNRQLRLASSGGGARAWPKQQRLQLPARDRLRSRHRTASGGSGARRLVLASPSRVLSVSRFSFGGAGRDEVVNARRALALRAFA